MKLKRKILNFFAAIVMIFGSTPSILLNAYAEEPVGDAPKHEKTLTSNGDGTYTVTLSVTGKASSSTVQNVTKSNVILVVDTSNSMNSNAAGYSGTRLEAEKNALTKTDGIIDKLLANNTAETTDIIELYGINFGTRSSAAWDWSTDGSTIKSAINGLTTSRGTNWEEALILAKQVADAKHAAEPEENTYVIFMTDGEPTTHQNSYNVNPNYGQEWGYANDDARAIVTAGYTFYGIFTFGSGNSSNYLKSLVNYAYTGSGTYNSSLSSEYAQYFYDATDTQALINALEAIIDEISSSVGYTNIAITDGLTDLTSSMKVDGKISGLTYTRSGGSYGTGTVWTDAPQATTTDGSINWNLGSTVLEDGVTYSVSFVVWPEQESYDLVADLNNGRISYNDLTDAQKSSVIKISDDSYALKTNTDYPTLTYSTISTTTSSAGTETVISNPTTINIDNPSPVGLAAERLTLEKKWEDNLDPSQRKDVNGTVTLDLYKDDEPYEQNIELTEENSWKIEDYISIAPGIIISSESDIYDQLKQNYTEYSFGGKSYIILENGHDYYFEEEDINNHFDLTNYIYHPMLVDGQMKNVFFTRDGSGNITGIEEFKDMDSLSATNTLKGGILVGKKVINNGKEDTTIDDEYEITITLDGADEGQYRIYTYNEDGSVAGRSEKISYTDGEIEEKIKVNQKIMVTDVPTGTTFDVTEKLPDGYTRNKVDYELVKYDGTENEQGVHEVYGNTSATATVTNYLESGDLKISKEVTNESGNLTQAQNQTFDFTAKFYKKQGDAEPVRTETFTLKHGESKEFKNIPDGWYYEIVEDAKAGFNGGEEIVKTGTVKAGEETEIEVENKYTVSPIDAKIIAHKDFVDGYQQFWIDSDSFEFQLIGDNQILESKSATLSGSTVEFDVNIADAGTYVYRITEKTQNEDGTSAFRPGVLRQSGDEDIEVTIVVVDNGDGTLSIESQTYSKASQTIYNLYEDTKTYGAEGELEFEKVLEGRDWDDSDEFTFTLSGSEGAPLPKNTELTANIDHKKVNFGTIKFSEKDAGKTYNYTIKESFDVPSVEPADEVAGGISFTIAVEFDKETGTMNLVVSDYENTFTNIYKTVNLGAEKIWDDDEDRDGLRENYDGYFVAVKNDEGKYVAYDELALEDKDDYLFINLPEKNAEGEVIEYEVVEASTCSGEGDAIKCTEFKGDDNYAVTIVDGVITNKHQPEMYDETGELKVKKIWQGEGNELVRPSSVLVELLANGEVIDTASIVAGQNDEWTHTFTGLYKNQGGEEIEYSVQESKLGETAFEEGSDVIVVYNDDDTIAGSWTKSVAEYEVTNTWTEATDEIVYEGASEFAIEKIDGDGDVMKGVTFTINGKDKKTDEEGLITKTVPISKNEKEENFEFTIKEKKTLKGYRLVKGSAKIAVNCTSEFSNADPESLVNTYIKTCEFEKSGSEKYVWNEANKVLTVVNKRIPKEEDGYGGVIYTPATPETGGMIRLGRGEDLAGDNSIIAMVVVGMCAVTTAATGAAKARRRK